MQFTLSGLGIKGHAIVSIPEKQSAYFNLGVSQLRKMTSGTEPCALWLAGSTGSLWAMWGNPSGVWLKFTVCPNLTMVVSSTSPNSPKPVGYNVTHADLIAMDPDDSIASDTMDLLTLGSFTNTKVD